MSTDVAALVSDNLDLWTSAIDRKSGAGRGGGKRISLYGIERLRALILDLAVRGKLVPQDAEDEPAQQLLTKIESDRAELTKAKAIGKGKAFPTVSAVPPFAIPEGWAWVQLSDIGHDWGQAEPESDFTYIDVGSIDQKFGIVRSPTVLPANAAPSRARKRVKQGTVIYSTVRPYLLNIATIDQDFNPQPVASTAFAIVHPFDGVEAGYVFRYLRSPAFVRYVEGCQTGIAYPAINDRQFFAAWFPLPPHAEQQRIVAKVDELMALCDELEAQSGSALEAHQSLVETLLATLVEASDPADLARQWARLEMHFDILFTTDASIEALKRVSMHLAVLGRLVSRHWGDETAEEALRKASEAKEALFRQEGLRARLASSTGTLCCPEGTMPNHWVTTNFDTVFVIVSGVTKGQRVAPSEAIEASYLRVANVQRGYLDLEEVKSIIVKRTDFERYRLRRGDVLMTEGGDWDKLGRAAIWSDEIGECIHQNHVFRVRSASPSILPEWVAMFVNCPLGREYFGRAAKQTTNLASINLTQLRACPLPIPPLPEQQRIIAKVDELMALCDALKARISEAEQIRKNLADAVVERAAA